MPVVTLPAKHDFFKTIRDLGPAMVFLATSILMAASIVGTVVAFFVYNVQDSDAGFGTSQSLTLISCAVSFVFIGLYLLAARRDEPVSKVRPPTLPLHGACFIIMRITTLLWSAATLVALVAVLNPVDCQDGSKFCLLQRINMRVSIIAILAAIVILLGLENCDEPFKTPSTFKIQPRIVCRVSYFDDILEDSVSQRSSFNNIVGFWEERASQADLSRVTQIKKTFEPAAADLLPEGFPCASILLDNRESFDKYHFYPSPTYPSHKLNFMEGTSKRLQSNCVLLSKSGRSITQKSILSQSKNASGSPSEGSASDSVRSPSRSSIRRRASPSSSLSSYSRRSPLSTMRNVEDPELPVETDVQVCSAQRNPSSGESSIRHAIHGSALPATTIHVKSWRKRARPKAGPDELRRQTVQSRTVKAGMNAAAAKVAYHNIAIPEYNVVGESLLGVKLDGRSQESMGIALDVHWRIIEESIHAAVKSRMQQDQQTREQAVQDEVTAEDARNPARPWGPGRRE